MVVLVVDDLGITVGKAKSDAPVCLNCYRPNPFPCSLKLVQMQCWNVHVVNGLCFVKLRENQAEPFSVNRLDSSSIAGKEEFLQSLVSEGFDHKDYCNPFGHTLQPIRLRSIRTTSAVQRGVVPRARVAVDEARRWRPVGTNTGLSRISRHLVLQRRACARCQMRSRPLHQGLRLSSFLPSVEASRPTMPSANFSTVFSADCSTPSFDLLKHQRDLPGQDTSLSLRERRIYKMHPNYRRGRTSRSRARSSRVHHASYPVFVHRPAALD